MLPNSNCKLPNIEVAKLAVWPCDSTKACCVLQAYSCHLKSERKSMSHISDPMPKKKAEVCSKTWKKAKGVEAGKKYVEQGINLNASNMCYRWEKT